MSLQRRYSLIRAALVVLLLSAVVVLSWGQDLPKPGGFVNDFANVIPPDDERSMQAIAQAVQQQTGAEIAVVTVNSISPYATIEDYGIALADAWKVGSEQNDDGVILLLAMDVRQVRIEVGYGLEGAITDGRAGQILDEYVLPSLRQGDYGAGLTNGVAVLAQEIADEYGVTLQNVDVAATPAPSADERGSGLGNLFYLFFLLLFFGGRWFLWPLLFAGRRRGFFGGGFGSGSSGGGFGGGSFGGFGGGGFGGGGASRGF
jgi:uncharacterized protein